ncbi:uncharacterized protein BHQ10_008354 [Talaromyces amestolkiae]|uniref:GST C-terminal domain-containing protein n=1 Tax=Talaromyces amestolkiae TaxID=1196081 RepID=A0A364L950_TALAM|nr:uncharacterized protein BHQ10_008354 [Talaromyces amestolkiae]RAO72342.1 hypothetical protein BHQ10_008354 [Talaromyces amestolkiae]
MNLVEVQPRRNIRREEYVSKFPLSQGKIPGLEGPKISLTETIAISLYLARLSNTAHLLGDGSLEQEAQVISYVSWANEELLNILAKWYLPLIPNFANPPPYDREAVELGKKQSLALLNKVEEQIGPKAYLVGNSLTLADIFLAIFISRGLEWVLGAEWRERHPNIMRYFLRFADMPEVKEVVPHFILIDKETANEDPYAKK